MYKRGSAELERMRFKDGVPEGYTGTYWGDGTAALLPVAELRGDELICSKHKRRVAMIRPEGIQFWCKSDGGHGVLLTWERLEEIKRSQEVL